MKVAVLPVGQVAEAVLHRVRERVASVFPETECVVVKDTLALPERAFDPRRGQYLSSFILGEIAGYAFRNRGFDRVLGVVDADIFVPELNFVFGEAACPGKAALISLWRLKPEFYGAAADVDVFVGRAGKEAVHEVGHTLGLRHCERSSCVMFFSNSVLDTDKKQSLFCDECYLQAAMFIDGLG